MSHRPPRSQQIFTIKALNNLVPKEARLNVAIHVVPPQIHLIGRPLVSPTGDPPKGQVVCVFETLHLSELPIPFEGWDLHTMTALQAAAQIER
jgi:hypothetical protein